MKEGYRRSLTLGTEGGRRLCYIDRCLILQRATPQPPHDMGASCVEKKKGVVWGKRGYLGD